MRVIRVLFGFALACLAAAVTLVLFVYTPAELASMPSGMGADRVTEAGLFALVVTPHVAAFAALPALIGVIIAERRGISSLGYYAILGIVIAALGFLTAAHHRNARADDDPAQLRADGFPDVGPRGRIGLLAVLGPIRHGPASPPRAMRASGKYRFRKRRTRRKSSDSRVRSARALASAA